MRFDHRKVCGSLTELWRVRFEHHKAYRKLAELWRTGFDPRKVCRRLAELWSVRFDHRKACWRLAEVKRSVLTTAMRVVDLQSFGECVSTTVKPLGGCRAMESVY